MQRAELPLYRHTYSRAKASLSFDNCGHRRDQAEVGQGAAACHRLWWMLDPDHAVPASHSCHYFNPLLHLKKVNLLPCFYMSLGRWKVLQVFFFLAYLLAVVEKILMTVCPKPPEIILYILDNTHSNKQGLSLFSLGYWRSSVNTAAGSGLVSTIMQKPSSSMGLLGTLWPLQASQCC